MKYINLILLLLVSCSSEDIEEEDVPSFEDIDNAENIIENDVEEDLYKSDIQNMYDVNDNVDMPVEYDANDFLDSDISIDTSIEHPIVCYDHCQDSVENRFRNENDLRCIDNKAYRTTTERFLVEEENPKCPYCCICERRILEMELLEDCSESQLACKGGKCIQPYARIEPGLILGDEVAQPTGITHPFWMSTTEITQREFLELLYFDNRRVYPQNNYYSITPEENIHPENPIVGVSWLFAIQYANALSLQEGLQPCYDENGNVIGGDMSNPYLCEGYRLPTEIEWIYVCQSSMYAESYCYGDPECLDQYEWTRRNASTNQGYPVLQKVAQRQPNLYGIYDIMGNAREWIYDSYEYSEIIGDIVHRQGLDSYLNNSNTKISGGLELTFMPQETFNQSCYDSLVYSGQTRSSSYVSFHIVKTIFESEN